MHLFPTAYFGSIAYYRELVTHSGGCIDAHEHFIKQTLRSRCEILGPNGVQVLSIPVNKPGGSKTPVREVEIDQSNWQKLHWKAIETAYGSAPFFDYYGMEVEELIHFKSTNLLAFNQHIHDRICSWLDLEIPLHFSERFYAPEELESDFRSTDFSSVHNFLMEKYIQVFRQREECVLNLSILDLVFNEGPMARKWLRNE